MADPRYRYQLPYTSSLRNRADPASYYTANPGIPDAYAPSETQKAIRRGGLNTRASLLDSMASANALMGDEQDAIEYNRKANTLRNRAASAENRAEIGSLDEANSVGEYLSLARNRLMETLPTVGAVMAGGAVGGLVKGGLGAMAGGAATYDRIAAGDNFGAYMEDPSVREGQSLQDIAKEAELRGAQQAVIGAAPIGGIAQKLMRGGAGKSLARNVAETAVLGAGAEAGTEVFEQIAQNYGHQQLNPDVQLFDDQAMSDYAEAAFGGAVGGGVFGGAAGAAGHTRSTVGDITHAAGEVPAALREFDAAGLGLGAQRRVQKAMQAGEDGVAALRRFASENEHLLGAEGVGRIREALAAQGLAGITPHPARDAVDERIIDEDVADEKGRAYSRNVAAKLKTVDPRLAAEVAALEGLGFDDPDVQRRLDELDVQFSRSVGGYTGREMSQLRELMVDPELSTEEFTGTLLPALEDGVQRALAGEVPVSDLREALSGIFSDPDTAVAVVEQRLALEPGAVLQQRDGDTPMAGEDDSTYYATQTVSANPEYQFQPTGRAWKKDTKGLGRSADEAVVKDSSNAVQYEMQDFTQALRDEAQANGLDADEWVFAQATKYLRKRPAKELVGLGLTPEQAEAVRQGDAQAVEANREAIVNAISGLDVKVAKRTPAAVSPADDINLTDQQVLPSKGATAEQKARIKEAQKSADTLKEMFQDAVLADLDARDRQLVKRYRELADTISKKEQPSEKVRKEYRELAQTQAVQKYEAALADNRELLKAFREAQETLKKAKFDVETIIENVDPRKSLPVGRFTLKVDGKAKVVNAMNLTASLMGTIGTRDQSIDKNAEHRFTAGLAALMDKMSENGTKSVAVDKGFDDNLIVSRFGGRNITLGEISKQGAARIREQIKSIAMKEKSPEVAQRLDREATEKRIAAIQKQLPELRDRYSDARKSGAPQQELDDIAKLGNSMKRALDRLQKHVLSLPKAEKVQYSPQVQKLLEDYNNLLDTERRGAESGRTPMPAKDVEVGTERTDGELGKELPQEGNSRLVEEKFEQGKQKDKYNRERIDEPSAFKVIDTTARNVEAAEKNSKAYKPEHEFAERTPAAQLAAETMRTERDIDRIFREAGIKYSRPVTPSIDSYRYMENAAKFRKDTNTLNIWNDSLGLGVDVSVLSTEQVQQHVDVTNAVTNALKVRDPKTGKYGIWVRPDITDKARKALLAHEMGHVVFQESVRGLRSVDTKALKSEFEKWREQFGRTSTVGDINVSKKTLAELADGLDKNSHLTLGELSSQDRDYLLDFEEWFADNVSRWLTTRATPQGAVQQFFDYVAGLLRDFFGVVQHDVPAKSVDAFMRSLRKAPAKQVAAVEPSFARNVADELPEDFIKRVTGLLPKRARLHTNATEDAIYLAVNAQDAYGEAANASLRYAFESGELLTAEETRILQNAFTQSATKRQLLKLLEGHPDAEALVRESPEAAAAYGFQFWLAGELELGPKTESVFRKVMKLIQDVLGIVSESKQAEQIMQAFAEGRMLARSKGEGQFVVQRQLEENLLHKTTAVSRIIGDTVTPYARKVLSLDDQVRGLGNAHLTALVDQFYTKVGSAGQGEGLLAARERMRARFEDRLHNIFDGKDEAFGQRMAAVLNGLETPQNEEEVAALRKVHGLLKEIYEYSGRAGVSMGFNGGAKPTIAIGKKYDGYYTRVWDVDKLQRRSREFKEMLTKYAEVSSPENIYVRLVENYGDTESASDALLNEHSSAPEEGEVGTGTPWAASAQERKLGFISKEDAAPFLSDDMGLILSTYISQQVKRAEYTRRFGRPGTKSIDDYFQAARKSGASDKDIETARRAVRALMGTLGSDIHPAVHRWQGAVMVAQNFAVLGLATLTSMTDVLGIAVRGELDNAWGAWKAGVAELKNSLSKSEKSELLKLAEGLGTVEQHSIQDALGYEYGGYYVTGTARKWNERLFKWNGLQGWTKLTRLMALKAGQSFLVKHGTGSHKHSERWLSELNVKKEDIKLNDDGSLRVLTHAERKEAYVNDREEYDRDERVRVALNRFVDEAILRPNAAQRPIWASDPHYMLMFHLKAFTYSFHDRILKRVAGEVAEGNYRPLLMLGSYMPMMVLIEMLRDTLQGDGDEKDDWDFGDWAGYSAERAGLLGIAQFGVDAVQDVQYGNPFGLSWAGPTAEHAYTLFDDGPGVFVERGLPGQSIWKDWGDE